MRVLYVLPLAAALGCAHSSRDESSRTTASASPPPASAPESASEPAPTSPPASAAATPSPAPTTSPGWTADEQAAQGSATGQGPATAAASTPCAPVRVQFAFDSDVIEVEDKPMLDDAARCLSNHERVRVSVIGNADDIGTEEYNRALGERRAKSVAHYLEDRGVDREQLQTVISRGEDDPLCEQEDAACRAKNRRTAVRATCHL